VVGGRDKHAAWGSAGAGGSAGHEEEPPKPTRRYSPDAEMADILYRAAQQPQPQRIEDVWRRADVPDTQATSADAPAAMPAPSKAVSGTAVVSAKKWAPVATRRLREQEKISERITQRDLAVLLEAESGEAAKRGELRGMLKSSYIENQLGPWGIWPLSSFK
jgi:hypothetical protein